MERNGLIGIDPRFPNRFFSHLRLMPTFFLVLAILLLTLNISYSEVYIKNGDFEPATSGITEEAGDAGWGTEVSISASIEEKYSRRILRIHHIRASCRLITLTWE